MSGILGGTICNLHEAVKTTPPDHPNQASFLHDLGSMALSLNNLANRRLDKYVRTGELEDIEEAICNCREAIQTIPHDHSFQALLAGTLSSSLCRRYERTGDLKDLNEAIHNFKEALKRMEADHPHRGRHLRDLGVALHHRFKRTGAVEDLEEAIRNHQEAIKATEHDHSTRALSLNSLANSLLDRYERTGELEDIEEAICNCQEAIQTLPHDHSYQVVSAGSLGRSLCIRYERRGDLEDLKKAIHNFKEALKRIGADHPHRGRHLLDLGLALHYRYERTGAPEDLEEVIHNHQEAIKATEHDHSTRALSLNSLANSLLDRYERRGELEDIEEAICNCRKAIQTIPHDHSHQVSFASNLSRILGRRYERTRDLEDLKEAIHNCKEALKRMEADHPYRGRHLVNLGEALYQRSERTGALEDLDEAILNIDKAIKTSPHDHPKAATWISNLGELLAARYSRTGALEDLEEAIRNHHEVLTATPQNDRERARRLNFLGSALIDRYVRTRALGDLEEAIHNYQEAIKTTPHGHTTRGAFLHDLANSLLYKYKWTGELEDLEEAIRKFREAIQTMPHDHSEQAMLAGNMSRGLHMRYERTRDLEDLKKVIYNCHEALKRTQADDPQRGMLLLQLGIGLESKYKRTGLPEDFENGVASFSSAASMEIVLPMHRISAGYSLGNLFVDNARWVEASEAFESALNLLPRVSPQSLSRTDQEYVLSKVFGLSSLAASTALQANRAASDALKLLEAGRCVIAGFDINSRSDVSDLRKADQAICEKYEKCREEFTRTRQESTRTRQKSSTNEEYRERVASRQKSLRDLTAVETEIRQIQGFERFQLPPEPKELMRLAESGPIVAFNVSRLRSDAIIVTSTRIWAKELPDLSYDTLEATAKFISTAGTTSRRDVKVRNRSKHSQRELEKDLLWLWKVAVLPILNELENELGRQQIQRVWWVTGGIMGLVPIHAAGDHSEGSLENTLSRVVSSYTSTFKALRYAREKVKDKSSDYRMLVVDMRETPEHQNLNTEHEVKAINNEFGDHVTLLRSPTKAEVIDKLGGCSFAHFACHGTSNPQDPAEGGLLLVEEGKPTLLSIRELDKVNLQRAEVAYLSACSTAELADGALLDEAIHLSNSFQMIGFRHVIGTMWGANDRAAGAVAGLFYRALFKSKGDSSEEFQVAQALHDALVEFRSRPGIREDVIKWAPFIHVGA